jgi:hypothetical protein
MPPKTPKQLLDQVLKRNKDRPADGNSMTAEGQKVPNPTRGEFFKNLEKAADPESSNTDKIG